MFSATCLGYPCFCGIIQVLILSAAAPPRACLSTSNDGSSYSCMQARDPSSRCRSSIHTVNSISRRGEFFVRPGEYYTPRYRERVLTKRRGHRQILHQGRFDELRKSVWLQHSIPHVIARRLELTSDGGGWGCL